MRVRMRKQKIAYVDGQPRALVREQPAKIRMNGKLDAAGDCKELIDSEHAGSKKYLVGIASWDRRAPAFDQAGMLADQLSEEPPIPLMNVRAPRRRSVAIDQTSGNNIRPLVSGALSKVHSAGPDPKIIAA